MLVYGCEEARADPELAPAMRSTQCTLSYICLSPRAKTPRTTRALLHAPVHDSASHGGMEPLANARAGFLPVSVCVLRLRRVFRL
jgi:hypothetical protein